MVDKMDDTAAPTERSRAMRPKGFFPVILGVTRARPRGREIVGICGGDMDSRENGTNSSGSIYTNTYL